MGRCKEIEIKVIPASVANPFVKRHHYSGKVVNNSQLHFGAFLDGNLHGVLSYGPSIDKKKVIGLVRDTPWNGFLELNRMAFDDYLPRNSESYCIGATLRMIRKQAPQIKWVVSFADGTQCGDGTIYRASNFILTGININKTIILMPDGSSVAGLTLDHQQPTTKARYDRMCGLDPSKSYTRSDYIKGGGKVMKGYQLRYIYFIDPKWRKRLTVPELPFSKIDELGAGMYKGQNITRESRHTECEAQKERKQSNGND
jgi:hypothetical protein